MDYPDKETRKQKRLHQLGTRKPVCVSCGETDSRCFEDHHIAGRKQHSDTARLCCNCHRKVTDDQKDHPENPISHNPVLDTIGHYLMGLGDLLMMVAEALLEFGRQLIEMAGQTAFATEASS